DLAHRRRLSVKPGLTCLWQVSGRNDMHDFTDWVRLGLEYIDNWSLWLDLKILCRTIPVVLLGTGGKRAGPRPARSQQPRDETRWVLSFDTGNEKKSNSG